MSTATIPIIYVFLPFILLFWHLVVCSNMHVFVALILFCRSQVVRSVRFVLFTVWKFMWHAVVSDFLYSISMSRSQKYCVALIVTEIIYLLRICRDMCSAADATDTHTTGKWTHTFHSLKTHDSRWVENTDTVFKLIVLTCKWNVIYGRLNMVWIIAIPWRETGSFAFNSATFFLPFS